MKYIIKDTGQIITVRNREFYYPPLDKWIEDKYLPKYDPIKLRDRFGIYLFKDNTVDTDKYKILEHQDQEEDTTITRTYTTEPRWTDAQMFTFTVKKLKREGISKYAEALRVEPILELTGDNMDIVVYKQSLRDAFMAARGVLVQLRDDTTKDYSVKYDEFKSYQVTWPDLPVDEETWRDYGNS